MTKKSKELSILSANLDFENHGEVYKNKTCSKIAKFLLSKQPTFIALQEVGNNNKELTMIEMENILKAQGYNMISPEKDGSRSVNTRLFYNAKAVEFVKELKPLYHDFQNRQCGGVFIVNNQTIAVYSLHFPLYSNKPTEKKEMWDKYIEFVSQDSLTYDNIILAGDFNECLINQTALVDKIIDISRYMVDASHDLPTWKNRKLDHIFITPNTKIENYSTLDNCYSDHKALYLSFTI